MNLRPAGKRGDRRYPKRRPLGLAAWKPYAPTRPLIDGIDRVLAE